MLRVMITGVVCCLILPSQAQPSVRGKRNATDSFRVIESRDYWQNDLPVVGLQETIKSEDAVAYIPSLLGANRDLFISTASFHFNAVRFRQRGYDAEWSTAVVNGIPMNNSEDGNTPWAYWSGLNDVTRNTQMTQGLRAGDMDFGSIGNTMIIDMRAFKQREQTQFGYSFSNRNYTHRWMFSHNSGFDNNRWAFSASGSIRYAEEGYMPGTFYRGGSYFIAADKKIDDNRIFSCVLFGSGVYNGRQSPVLQETADLLGTHSYNSYWGYQSGRKRNANTGKTHVPVLILTYDQRFTNRSSLMVSIAGMAGRKSSTALDWYNSADPRPDYYRYLPSYQKDSLLHNQVLEAYREKTSLQQVDWEKLYAVNKNSYSVTHDADGIAGNTTGGLRAHYILEERITDIRRFVLNMVYTGTVREGVSFIAGGTVQWQQLHYYKRIDDLLGGEYYVDWNQFAEGDASVLQNDLNRPNRILHKGDAYGYNYRMLTGTSKTWVQVSVTRKKIDAFIAGKMQYTCYLRNGLVKTGLFPGHSFGRSRLHEFADYAAKAGITYKINGRKYIYLHALVLSRAPYPDNVFVSPRTRDTEQENIISEKVGSMEAGYVWNAPVIKLRWTAYLAKFTDGMNILTFYHDAYRNFVNYALSGIDKLHFGMELGAEIKLSPHYTVQLAAAAGRYSYSNRQQVTVSADNDAYITERGLIYTKNFRMAGTPQEAYSIGIAYQSSGSLYANITAAYFRQQWLEFNPLRRTYTALQGLVHGSDQWVKSVQQTLLPDQHTIDVSLGTSFRARLGGEKKRTILLFVGINNLLNKKDIISGGYEQLRFDAADIDKFPPKFFYAMGLNFSVNCTLRL
jgi:hypothetical protein